MLKKLLLDREPDFFSAREESVGDCPCGVLDLVRGTAGPRNKVGYEARSKDLGGEISLTQGSIRDSRSSLFVVLRSDGRQLVMHVRALRGIVAGARRFFHYLHIKTYR